jgi:predicted transcriptional regulator
MSNDEIVIQANFIELTAEIVAAYIANNAVQASSLPALIASVHASVAGLSNPAAAVQESPVPAINPKKSVHPDYIICLDDGKKFKSMKRHLAGLGMTPAEYRAKWGLAADYPMVAPDYAAARSEMAKKFGLGRKPVPVKPKGRRARKAA